MSTLFNFPTIGTRDCGAFDVIPPTPDGGSGATGLIIATTLAQLRAHSPITGVQAALLFGVDNPGDSLLTAYYWDAVSLLDDNGLSVVKFDLTAVTDPGRLIQCGSNP